MLLVSPASSLQVSQVSQRDDGANVSGGVWAQLDAAGNISGSAEDGTDSLPFGA